MNNPGYSRQGAINIRPLPHMQELYEHNPVANNSRAQSTLARVAHRTPHTTSMDDLELDDYMDDNLGEDTLATDALWAQAFDPARTSSSAPVLPQVATPSTQPQQASPQPPPRETPRPGPAHQCNPRPRRNAPAPSWLRNFETGEQASGLRAILPQKPS